MRNQYSISIVCLVIAILLFQCNPPAKNIEFVKNTKVVGAGLLETDSLKKIGSLRHKNSVEIDDAPWGIEFNVLAPHFDNKPSEVNVDTLAVFTEKLLEKAAGIGIKWARVSVNWSTIEDDTGNYHWQYLDDIVDGLKKRKIEPYICIHGGHPVHTEKLPPVSSESGMQAWLQFVETMVQQYNGKVRYWEIWNEPNYKSFWKPKPDAAQYVELVQKTSPLIQKNIPDAVIIGGSMARFDIPFARKMFALGIDSLINVITYHPYNAMPEGYLQKIAYPVHTPHWYMRSSNPLSELQNLISEHNNKIVYWQGECGYPSGLNSHGWQGTGPWGENIQAKWLLRRMLSDITAGARVTAYFALREYMTVGKHGRKNRKGLLCLENLQPKTAYFTYRNLVGLFPEIIQSEINEKSEIEIKDDGMFYGILPDNVFSMTITKSDGSKCVAYWYPGRSQEYIKPATIDIQCGMSIESPVLIDLLSGSVFEIASEQNNGDTKIINAPLTDYPLFITERRKTPLR